MLAGSRQGGNQCGHANVGNWRGWGGGRFSSTRELVAAYRGGSAEAAKVWLRSVRSLAAAMAGFINVLDPELIVIGGGIADADEALFGPLEAELERFEWRPGGAKV